MTPTSADNNLPIAGVFDGMKADYIYMLLVQWLFTLLVSFVMGLPVCFHYRKPCGSRYCRGSTTPADLTGAVRWPQSR